MSRERATNDFVRRGETDDPRATFIGAAVWHGSLDRADAILVKHPEIASSDIHANLLVPGVLVAALGIWFMRYLTLR